MRIRHKGAVLGFGLILASLVVVGLLWGQIPGEVPWLFSLAWGEGQLIDKYWFAGGLGMLGVVFFVDVLLGVWLGKKDRVLTDLVVWFGVGIVAVYLLSFWRVLMIII